MTENIPNIRTIKSFVRRTGRLTPGQKNALDQHWNQYGIDFDAEFINIDKMASDFKAIKFEIGIGNGDALVNMAENDPQSLFIGVEVHQPGVGRCLNNVVAKSLSNVRLISHDAIDVMQQMLPANSLDRILLFFPDPWHKKRHNKRRIVNQQFRDLSYRLLKSGGFIHMATDWQDYAEHMAREHLSDARFLNHGDSGGYCGRPDNRPVTHFEQRGLKLGHGVWDLLFEKC